MARTLQAFCYCSAFSFFSFFCFGHISSSCEVSAPPRVYSTFKIRVLEQEDKIMTDYNILTAAQVNIVQYPDPITAVLLP